MKSLYILLSLTLLFPFSVFSADEDIPWYRNPWDKGVTRAIAQLDDDRPDILEIPVLFGISVGDFDSDYGAPRSGGRSHAGQDILAPIGTPLVSPTDAVVSQIQTGPSAGHSIYTVIPGGETLAYLHLDSVNPLLEEGDTISRGDLLGYVGDTGNATGIPHLHFEVLTDEPTDPFPRLAAEFSLEEKMAFTERLFDELRTVDRNSRARFLATEYADEFIAARAQGLAVPAIVEQFLGEAPAVVTPPPAPVEVAAEIAYGTRSVSVRLLQLKLIEANSGAQARALAEVGATGYFGSLTRAAILEFQRATGLTADGIYGSATRAALFDEDAPTKTTPEEPVPSVTVPSTPKPAPQNNLTLGATGADVQWLQRFLIDAASGAAATTLAGYGATGYFGGVTKDALAEYQQVNGISPAVGYYGPVTRAFLTQ